MSYPSIGIFTTLTDPGRRGDNYEDAIKCYEDFADRLIIVDGHETWPQEFEWPTISQHFQWGYDKCDTDWVIHMDIDFLFHDKDFGKIRQALKDYPNSAAVSFYKWQFILPDRYNLKSRLILAVNKKKYGERIKFNGGGDGCQPKLDGRDLDINDMPQAGVPFYNYEKLLKTPDQIADDVGRMDRAYFRTFGTYMYGDGSDLSALDGWFEMCIGRFKKPAREIGLEEHPKYIRETITNLKPDQWGYGGFGLLPDNNYVKSFMHSR